MSSRISSHVAPSTQSRKAVSSLLSHFQPKLFRLNYSPSYTTFIPHHILNDPQHPLHLQRKREYASRKQEGLWWHVTSNADLAKSSVVRNTCRKRLRKAFADALRERGFDEHGRLVEIGALERHLGKSETWVKGQKKDIALTGSLRFHVMGPLIPAKYVDMKNETGMVLEALLEGVKADVGQSRREVGREDVRAQWTAPLRRNNAPVGMKKTSVPKMAFEPMTRGRSMPSSSQTRRGGRPQQRAVNTNT